MSAARILIVPGWRNSEPEHWQSLWEARLPGARRVAQGDWLFPRRQDWVDRLADDILSSRGERLVLVAHSLGCMAVAHLPPEAAARVSAALLVAPADPERRAQLADFAPVPYQRLPYRSILVASSNDPCCPVRLAGAYARAWGSEFVRLENAGHINVASGFGEWPQGLQLLAQLGVDVDPAELLRHDMKHPRRAARDPLKGVTPAVRQSQPRGVLGVGLSRRPGLALLDLS